jgi:hypothetical protein
MQVRNVNLIAFIYTRQFVALVGCQNSAISVDLGF